MLVATATESEIVLPRDATWKRDEWSSLKGAKIEGRTLRVQELQL